MDNRKWGRFVTSCDTCGGMADVRKKDADACLCGVGKSQKIESVPSESGVYYAYPGSAMERRDVVDNLRTSTRLHEDSPSVAPTLNKREILARCGVFPSRSIPDYARARWARGSR